MQKTASTYTINVLAEDAGAIGAQILFYAAGNAFSGRIDFYRAGQTAPASYLWHPNNPNDVAQTYIVLSMRMENFGTVATLLRSEGPWVLELWPNSPQMVGASNPGYAGKIFTSAKEPIGEEERSFQSGM